MLGTLHGGARARFGNLMRDDPALRARVAFWEEQLSPLASPLCADAPSAWVWEAIAARLSPRQPSAPRTLAGPGWIARWLAPWFEPRTLGALATGLMLGVAVTLMEPTALDPQSQDAAESQLPESYVGVLATVDGRTGMIVSSRRHGMVMDVKQVNAVPVPSGQTLFLWAIEADGQTRPIGPVPQAASSRCHSLSLREALRQRHQLALSIEAEFAAPLRPSGPFVYRGLCGKLWRVPAPKTTPRKTDPAPASNSARPPNVLA